MDDSDTESCYGFGSDEELFGFPGSIESGTQSGGTSQPIIRQSILEIQDHRIEKTKMKVKLKLNATQTLSYIDLKINQYKYRSVLNTLVFYLHIRCVSLDYLNTVLCTKLYNRKQIHLGNAEGKDVCSDINHILRYNGLPCAIMRTTKRPPTTYLYKALSTDCEIVKSFDKNPELYPEDKDETSMIKEVKSDIKYIKDPIIHKGVSSKYYKEEKEIPEIEYNPLFSLFFEKSHEISKALEDYNRKKAGGEGELDTGKSKEWGEFPEFGVSSSKKEKMIDIKNVKSRLKGVKTYLEALIDNETEKKYKKELSLIEEEIEESKYEIVIRPSKYGSSKEIVEKYKKHVEKTKELENDEKYNSFYSTYIKDPEKIDKYRNWFKEITEKNKGSTLDYIPEFEFPEGMDEKRKKRELDKMIYDSMYAVWGDLYQYYYDKKVEIGEYCKRVKVLSEDEVKWGSHKFKKSNVSDEKIKRKELLDSLLAKKKNEALAIETQNKLIKSLQDRKEFKSDKIKRLEKIKKIKQKERIKLFKKHSYNEVITQSNKYEALMNLEEEEEGDANYPDHYVCEWDDISVSSGLVSPKSKIIPSKEDFEDAFKIFEATKNFEDLFRTPDRMPEHIMEINPGANKVPRSKGRYYLILTAKIINLLKSGSYKKNIDKDIHMVRGCSVKFAALNIRRLIKRNPELRISIDLSMDNKRMFLTN